MNKNTTRAQDMAAMFKALSDPARLHIFEFLCSVQVPVTVENSGEVRPVIGLTVGEVCCRITGEDKVSSTISQQLKQLRHAGLILMERRGKNMICRASPDALNEISEYVEAWKKGTTAETCCNP